MARLVISLVIGELPSVKASIKNGCLIYTDDLIKKSEKAFGVTLPKIVPYDNIDATAEFIIKDIINPALEKGLNK